MHGINMCLLVVCNLSPWEANEFSLPLFLPKIKRVKKGSFFMNDVVVIVKFYQSNVCVLHAAGLDQM